MTFWGRHFEGLQLLLLASTPCLWVQPSFSFVIQPAVFGVPKQQQHHTLVFSSSSPSPEANGEEEEEEWHPHDPADTMPQLLAGLWHQIAEAGSMLKGVCICM
jgi:hypothetical protein